MVYGHVSWKNIDVPSCLCFFVVEVVLLEAQMVILVIINMNMMVRWGLIVIASQYCGSDNGQFLLFGGPFDQIFGIFTFTDKDKKGLVKSNHWGCRFQLCRQLWNKCMLDLMTMTHAANSMFHHYYFQIQQNKTMHVRIFFFNPLSFSWLSAQDYYYTLILIMTIVISQKYHRAREQMNNFLCSYSESKI